MKKKIQVGVKGELYSALTMAGLERDKTVEQIIEEKLMKDPEIKKLIGIVRAEPDVGVLTIGPDTRRRLREKKE